MRLKWIVPAVLLLAALAGGWWLASPWWTLDGMREAAEARDPEAFAAYVDFPALREDMKADLTARMVEEAGKDESGFGAFGAALGAAIAGPMIDAFVTPTGLAAAFAAGERAKAAGPAAAPAEAMRVGDNPVIERRGLNAFLVSPADASGTGLVFRRSGLGWKLAGVELPKEPEPRPQG